MALIPDYDPDEDQTPTLQGGARPTALGGGPSGPARPSGGGGGVSSDGDFVPWERFVSANKEVSHREADKLKGNVQGSVDRAVQGREDASAAQSAGVESNYATTPVSSEPERAPSAFGGQATSFGGGAQQPDGATAAQTPESGATIDNKRELATQDPAAALGAGSLEQQLGTDRWSGLVGDTAKAQADAKALGSEGGVQALLGQQTGVSNPFDAALISGAGGQDFRALSKEFGGSKLTDDLVGATQGAQDRWHALMGDIQTAGLDRDAANQRDLDAAAQRAKAEQDANNARVQIQSTLDDLNRNYPMLSIAANPSTFRNALNAAIKDGGAATGQFLSWARSIYGPDTGLSDKDLMTRLGLDVGNMSPEEFAMFAQGLVPPWMGLGPAAMGANGGFWWGIRNSNNQVSGGGPGDPSKLPPEQRAEYETKMKALYAFYQVLAAVATGAATAAGGPVLGAAVGAATQAGINAQGAATGAKP